MAAGHLVTDSDLPLLGYIDLGEFHHAVAQFVTDLDLVDDSPVAGLDLLPGYAVVVDEILDHGVGSLVSGPLAGIDACVIDVPELVHGDGFALGNDFGADKFADARALLALGEGGELLDELVEELGYLGIPSLLLCLLAEFLLVACTLAVALLEGFGIEGGLDYGTAEGWGSLE